MTRIFSPDEVPGFDALRHISKAVVFKEYREEIEAEIARVNVLIDGLLSQAVAEDDTDDDEYRLVVRYASGIQRKPDVSMLRTEFPDRYQRLCEEQLKSFKPSMTKADTEWLFADVAKADRDALISQITVEYPVRTQYVLQAKKGGEQ